MSDSNKTLVQKALSIHHILLKIYGDWEGTQHLDPVSELVCTILSQNTNDVNRDRAYNQLRERFPTWEAVLDADLAKVKESIRIAGLANSKGPAIQRALRQIFKERGEISLDFLAEMPLDEARKWLTSIKGVGPKTAAIVLLFSFNLPAFPVDTHIHRISKRLGLIGPKVSREKAHAVLESLLPPETYYAFHLNLISYGRQVCKARKPCCEDCSLLALCDYGRGDGYAMTQLLLIRHGQTMGNVQHVWQGWTEGELSPLGRQQVQATARHLATLGETFDFVYSSPLCRAWQTAEAVGQAINIAPVVCDGLKEMYFGEVEGLTLDEFQTRFPEEYRRWHNKGDLSFTWPGGESRIGFHSRVRQVFEEIITRHKGQSVLVVAHGGTLRVILAYLLPEQLGEWWTYKLGNCSLTKIELAPSGAKLLSLNDQAHLGDLSSKEVWGTTLARTSETKS